MTVPALRGIKKFYRWQTRAAVKFRGREADKHGVIGMSTQAITGTGKTFMALICSKIWFERYGSLARLVVVVPTEPLQKQWYDILSQENIANMSKQGGGKRYDGFAPIVVVIQASLKRLEGHKNLRDKKVLYILDEAHKTGAKGTLNTLKRIRHAQDMQGCIAISATLKRSDGNCIMDIAGYDGFNEKGERKPHISYGYDKAVAEGVIPPFRIHVYETTGSDLTYEESLTLDDYNKWIAIAYSKCKKNPNIHMNLLMSHTMDAYDEVQDYRRLTRDRKRFLNDLEVRYDIAHDLMLKHEATGDKYVLFHESIKGVERIANAAIEAGLDKPFIYHSGENLDWDEVTMAEVKKYKEYQRNRKKILAQWADPRLESGALLTVKALKEGFDVPEMDALIMLSHPNAPTPLIQATGRALRGNKNADGVWTNRHGEVIDEDNPKNIYIVVQEGTTDANCIPNMQEAGNIPINRFVHYRRQGGVWTPINTNNVFTEQAMDDDDEEAIEDEEETHPLWWLNTPALEFNAITGEMQPAVSAHQTGGIKQ